MYVCIGMCIYIYMYTYIYIYIMHWSISFQITVFVHRRRYEPTSLQWRAPRRPGKTPREREREINIYID